MPSNTSTHTRAMLYHAEGMTLIFWKDVDVVATSENRCGYDVELLVLGYGASLSHAANAGTLFDLSDLHVDNTVLLSPNQVRVCKDWAKEKIQ